MEKITTCLWFDNKAEQAVDFYTSVFENSKLCNTTYYGEAGAEIPGRPAKDTIMTRIFQLEGREFMALNGGPAFAHSPAISLSVSCKTESEIDFIFKNLSEGGSLLMPLDKYPFSEKFAWFNDKFGVSWQLNLGIRTEKIVPSLMFVGEQHGKAEAAMNFYVSQFKNSSIGNIVHYGSGEGEPEGTVKHAIFFLEGQAFMAMDSNRAHAFTFTPATSFIVHCQTQREVDEYWQKLSAGGEIVHCGWLRDKYGLSWQIVPSILGNMLQDKDIDKSARVMKALLNMVKLDIGALQRAYEG